jgi:phage protein D
LVDITSVGDTTGAVVLVEVMNEEGPELDEVDVGLEDALPLLQLPNAALQPASQ